jgi:hypothetical protein
LQHKIYSKINLKIAAISKRTVMAYNYEKTTKTKIPRKWKEKIIAVFGNDLIAEY